MVGRNIVAGIAICAKRVKEFTQKYPHEASRQDWHWASKMAEQKYDTPQVVERFE